MPWTRLDPTEIIPHLHFVHGPADQDDAAHAERDMERLRRALLTGEFIAVQDEFAETRSVCRWGGSSQRFRQATGCRATRDRLSA